MNARLPRNPRLIEAALVLQVAVFALGTALLAGRGELAPLAVTYAVSAVVVLGTGIAAIIVSRRRRSLSYAWVLMATAATFTISALFAGIGGWNAPTAVVVRSLIPVFTVLAIATFDTGRPATWVDRRITTPMLGVQVVMLLLTFAVAPHVPSGVVGVQCENACGGGWLDIESTAAGSTVVRLYIAVRIVVALALIVGVLMRLRALRGSRRTEYAYFGVTGAIWSVAVGAQGLVQMVDINPAGALNVMFGVQFAFRILLPFSLLLGLMLAEIRRGSTLEYEFAQIRSSETADDLRDHLSGLLEDPTLEIVAASGAVTGGMRDRAMVELRAANGQLVGTLVHRPGLEVDLPVPYAVAVPAATAAMERMDLARQMQALEADVDRARLQARDAGDAERARIERDLHDGAQARIVVLRARVSRLAGQQQHDDDYPGGALQALDDDLAALLAEVRSLGSGLRPLVPGTLVQSLRDHVNELPVPVTVVADPLDGVSEPVEVALYFCIREALQNTVKHAGPGARARVEIARRGDAVTFAVRDDGPGPGAGHGTGIDGMRQRLGAVGGTLDVEPVPGGGTLVCGRVALQPLVTPRDDR